MAYSFKPLLGKIVERGKKSVEGNDCVQLPENMIAYLEKRVHLLTKDMVALEWIGYEGASRGLLFSLVRISDRTKAYKQGVIVRHYRDLDKHPEVVLFGGHILKNGTVYVKKEEFMVGE